MRNFKRITALLAALALCLTLLPVVSLTVSAADPTTLWTDNAASVTWEGTGTEGDPYLITSEDHLVKWRNEAGSTTSYYKLTKDLDMSAHLWTAPHFTGTLDGDGHTINGLIINRTTGNNYGFIQQLKSGATVKNLNLDISMTLNLAASYANYGGIAAQCQGATIENCSVSGSITATLTNSSNGSVYLGGIVGVCGTNNGSTIENCVVTADINVTNNKNMITGVGGIVGAFANNATVNNCVMKGSVKVTNNVATNQVTYVGGIAGQANATEVSVKNCVNSGDLTVTTDTRQETAGIVGGVMSGKTARVINCANTGDVTATATNNAAFCSGIFGSAKAGTAYINNCYNTGTINITASSVSTTRTDIYYNQPTGTCSNIFAWNGTQYVDVSNISNNCADKDALLTALNAYVEANNSSGGSGDLLPWTMVEGYPVPGEAEPEEILPYASSIKAGDSLEMIFYFEQAKLTDNTWKAQITRTYADGTADDVKTINFADWSSDEVDSKAMYKFTYTDIAAKEMTDSVTIVILDADGEEVSEAYTETVESYALRTLKNTDDAKLKTALVDMLNYGAACQTNFGYNTNDLASPGDYTGFATQTNVSCASNPKDTQSLYGTSVINKETLVYTFWFDIDDVTAETKATITYKNHYGNDVELEVTGDQFAKTGNGYYGVDVTGIAVADGRAEITCVVKDGNNNTVAKATDSIEGYVARTLVSEADDINLCNALNALMKFVDSANAYFAD